MPAAVREFEEETRLTVSALHPSLVLYDAPVRHGGYALFYGEVQRQFRPVLNEEHEAYGWFRPDELPLPLHRGLRYQMRRLGVV